MDEVSKRNTIPMRYVIELGLIRRRDICAKCGNKIDIEDYHIQLCKSCRMVELEKYAENMLDKIDGDLKFPEPSVSAPRSKR